MVVAVTRPPQMPKGFVKLDLSENVCKKEVDARLVDRIYPNPEEFVFIKPTPVYDIPHEYGLPKSSHLCGYIEPDGTYHKCNSCEHSRIIREIIYSNPEYRLKYFETELEFYEKKSPYMWQEEYFAMKELGFVKISSFKDTPTDMVVFWYKPLTSKQTEIIYPR